jgi:hypothetical protein
MKRWHDEKAIMAKNVKERKRSTYDHSGQHPFDDKRAKLGYYRKLDAYDCGKPDCGICHPVVKGQGKDKQRVQQEIAEQLAD